MMPDGGEWRGPAGFERWLRAFGEQWSSLEVKESEFCPVGEVVFGRSHVYAVARATGQPADWPLLQFFKVRDARILELRPFHWDTAAMLPALKPHGRRPPAGQGDATGLFFGSPWAAFESASHASQVARRAA